MHTSGSTGLPAPVTCTHWSINTTDWHHLVPPLDERPCVWGSLFDKRRRNYLAYPITASSGIGAGITDICFNNITTVLGPPEQATAKTLEMMVQYAGIDSASCVPATLEDLAKHPEVLTKLRNLKHLSYVGGRQSCLASHKTATYTAQAHCPEMQEISSLNMFHLSRAWPLLRP